MTIVAPLCRFYGYTPAQVLEMTLEEIVALAEYAQEVNL